MKYFKFVYLLILCSLVFNSVNAKIFVHKLNHQLAVNVIPVIKPHLSNKTSMTAKNYQLFVDGSDEDNNKIMSILQTIDTRSRAYNVEIRILDQKMKATQTRNDQIKKNQHSAPVEIRRYKLQSSDKKNHQFVLKTIENQPAYIATGESFPSNRIQSQYNQLIPSSGRKKITTGFYITVQQQSDQQVLLSLSAHQQQRQSRYGQGVSRSSTSTIVKGKLGNWILAASTSVSSKPKRSRHYRTDSNRNKQRWYYVRVNKLQTNSD